MWIFSKYTENYENRKNMQFPLLRENDYFTKNKKVEVFSFQFYFQNLKLCHFKIKKCFK